MTPQSLNIPNEAIFTYGAIQQMVQAEFDASKVRHMGFGIEIKDNGSECNVKLSCEPLDPFDPESFGEKMGEINTKFHDRGLSFVTGITENKITFGFYMHIKGQSYAASGSINRNFESIASFEFGKLGLHIAGTYLEPVSVAGLELSVGIDGEDTKGKTIN